ncbi:MAG: hypothetical protein RLZZ241_2579 [Bacteroidota bacterium]|jgi:glycosyltransferase involved in cell wall biosynthesis
MNQVNQAKLSVVIPVYNAELYIKKCVDSITAQTYRNLEIILVNDGSKDSSLEVCHELAAADSRIRVLDQENGGSSVARNYGIDVATGTYITFVDADDFVEPQAYETMIRLLQENNLELVEFDRYNTRTAHLSNDEFSIESQVENLNRTLIKNRFQVWRRISTRALLGDLRFVVGRIHQDVFFSLELIKKVDKVGYLRSSFYHYNRASKSVIRSNYNEVKAEAAAFVISYLKANTPYNEEVQIHLSRYICDYFTMHLYRLANFPQADPSGKYLKLFKNEIRKNIWVSKSFNKQILLVMCLPWPIFKLVLKVFKKFR